MRFESQFPVATFQGLKGHQGLKVIEFDLKDTKCFHILLAWNDPNELIQSSLEAQHCLQPTYSVIQITEAKRNTLVTFFFSFRSGEWCWGVNPRNKHANSLSFSSRAYLILNLSKFNPREFACPAWGFRVWKQERNISLWTWQSREMHFLNEVRYRITVPGVTDTRMTNKICYCWINLHFLETNLINSVRKDQIASHCVWM